MKRLLPFLIIAFTFCDAWACTAVIVSGKATTDGRPFIFKNRDASPDNALLTLKGSKYQYVGVADYTNSSNPSNIWYGHNEAGFAILNTLSYYFNSPTATSNSSAGVLMKKALGQCATVEEFENLLTETLALNTYTLSTNFAVMDSLGNVAFYETNNTSFTKFDANDETVAPNGYLVRTNYSFSSPYYETTSHVGEERYKAACKYIEDTFGDVKSEGGKIDAVKLVHELPRYLYHGQRKVNLWDYIPNSINDVRHTYFKNFIPRHSSCSASLMQGVKEGEPAANTVNWIAIGWPCGSFTVPILLTPSLVLPETVKRTPDTHKSEMCSGSLELKDKVFTIYHDGKQSTDSIDLSKLINKQETGILQRVMLADAMVSELGVELLDDVRAGTADDNEIAAYYNWVDEYWRLFIQETSTPTAISAINADVDNDDAYYSIDGIRYEHKPSKPGIYIYKHRKVIIR